MIDYEEELKKFEPCLDVTDAEGAIYDRELTDILDVLQGLSIVNLDRCISKPDRYIIPVVAISNHQIVLII